MIERSTRTFHYRDLRLTWGEASPCMSCVTRACVPPQWCRHLIIMITMMMMIVMMMYLKTGTWPPARPRSLLTGGAGGWGCSPPAGGAGRTWGCWATQSPSCSPHPPSPTPSPRQWSRWRGRCHGHRHQLQTFSYSSLFLKYIFLLPAPVKRRGSRH